VISKTVSRRYARALLAIGREDGRYLRYGEELEQLAALLKENKSLADVLANPIHNLRNRKAVLRFVLEKTDVSPVVGNFLALLLEKNRIRFLSDIATFHSRLTDEIQNIGRATVISASPLPEEVVDRVKDALANITKKQIRISAQVDPEIIGGIITRVGDLSYDGSVRTQLLSLKQSLKRGE